MIALINLGNSNIQSVINALNYLNIDYITTANNKDLKKCSKIILPGVGTFGNGITRLKKMGMFDTIREEVLINNKPILGICLGMQMLFDMSEESLGFNGLGILSGKVVKLPISDAYKIPRIGWADSKVNFDFLGLKRDQVSDFYYIHSYYVEPTDSSIISIESDVGVTAAINFNNIYGCQFHPEKSHKNGLKILEEFAKLNED